MCRNPLSRNFAGLSSVSICALILAFISVSPASWAQAPYPQVQGQMGQYPPGRPAPIGAMCQSELVNRVNADAGRRVNLNLDSQSEYPVQWAARAARQVALRNWRFERLENRDLRLCSRRSPQSRGTRDLQPSGEQR
jgi:hypothetical protein